MSASGSPRIGLIGCGVIAERFHLPALNSLPGVAERLVLADTNESRLREMAQHFDIASTVADYRELADQVDGVVVAVPPFLHREVATFFLHRGVHVLCEKPLAESTREAEEMIAAAQSGGAVLAVNHTRRLFPTYGKIRELIAEGTLGELQSLTYHDGVDFEWPAASRFHFLPDSKGVLSDTGVHLLDSVCYWLDAQPELVASHNDSFGGPEAVATVHLRHRQCRIEIMVSRLSRLMNGFRIEGCHGYIEAGAEDWNSITVRFHNGKSRRFNLGARETKYCDFALPLMRNFIEVIVGDASPLISGQSALCGVRLLERAYECAERFVMPWNEQLEVGHVA